jgi:hypothetical protein
MNTFSPSQLLCGFLLFWIAVYFIFPSVLMRLREPRRTNFAKIEPFLAETGTVHRLGRDESTENRKF